MSKCENYVQKCLTASLVYNKIIKSAFRAKSCSQELIFIN